MLSLYCNWLDSVGGLSRHLGTGAVLAASDPAVDVPNHAVPHHPLLHQSPGGPGIWVAHGVEGGEHLMAIGCGYHWLWVLARGVAQYPDGAKGYQLQVQ